MDELNKGAELPYTVVELGRPSGTVIFGQKLTEEQIKDPLGAWRAIGSSCIILDKKTGSFAAIQRPDTNGRPSMKARAKGLKAFDGDKLKEEVRQLKDLLTPRQPQKFRDDAQIIKRIESILREPSKAGAQRLIDRFVRDLEAARRVAFSDKQGVHPFTKKPVAEASGKHVMFIAAVCRLTQQKKEPPTHGETERELLRVWLEIEELARESREESNLKRPWKLANIASYVSKLCAEHGLSWLPSDP